MKILSTQENTLQAAPVSLASFAHTDGPAKPGDSYEVKAITALAELEGVRPFWDAAKPVPGADYEHFVMAIGRRTNILSPCVLEVSQHGKTLALWPGRIETAILPLRLGYATLGKINVRQAVFIAGGFMGLQTEATMDALLSFTSQLLLAQKLDLAIFEHVAAASPLHGSTQRVLRRGQLSPVRDDSTVWLMKLPQSYDEFLKSRSKKHRYWLKRLVSVLDREFAGKWTVKKYTSQDEAREFAEAAEMVAKSTYQRSMGVGFHLNQESRERIEQEARGGRLRGYLLWLENEPKAFWHCFVHQDTLYLAATGYDPGLAGYELGTVLLMKIFQEYCGTEVATVNFGLGDAGYKQRFASDHFVLTTLYVFSRTLRGLRLNVLRSSLAFSTKLGKAVLNRLQVTQRVKTLWRRRMRARNTTDSAAAAA